jgi:hypothetical protein
VRVLLDGIEVREDCVTYWGLGFGQTVDLPTHSYEIQMSLLEFVDALEGPYVTLIQELRSVSEYHWAGAI